MKKPPSGVLLSELPKDVPVQVSFAALQRKLKENSLAKEEYDEWIEKRNTKRLIIIAIIIVTLVSVALFFTERTPIEMPTGIPM